MPDYSSSDTFSLDGGAVGYSAPAIGEIDGDSSDGLEMAFGGSDGMLHVLHSDGSKLWSQKLPNYGCSSTGSTDKNFSAPAIGALFGDGVPYVVIGYGGFGGGNACDGGVVAFRGSDGKKRWTFSIKQFAHTERFYTFLNSVFSTPALADVDGDGKLEIGFGSFDRNVYLLNSNGRPRWYYHAADTVWSSPAFANIDNDPNLEMLIGTDISRNDRIVPPTSNGGFLLAFKTSAAPNKSIPFRDPAGQNLIWLKYFNQVVFSSPTVADVLPSRAGNELIIGSGCYFPENTTKKLGAEFRVVDLKKGKLLATLKTNMCSPSSPAVGDVNGDGLPDIVVTTPGTKEWGGDGNGRVYAWTPSTKTLLWETTLPAMFPFQSPLIADLDQDGKPEVIVTSAAAVSILDGTDGSQVLKLRTTGTVEATAAIGDLDGDGLLDIVVGGGKGASGFVDVWSGFIKADGASGEAKAIDASVLTWPQWRGSASRQGTGR